MNIHALQSQLSELDRKRTQLEKRIRERRSSQYAALPRKFGLRTIDELILQLLPHGSAGLRARFQERNASAARSRGTRYSSEVKGAVKRAVEAGGKTVAQISREFGPSVFSIKDWKKQWGLTRARKSPARNRNR
jgi:hypothetical protein